MGQQQGSATDEFDDDHSLISQQMKQRCRDAGAEACITKPQINELVSTMDSLLQVAAPAEPFA